MLELDISLEFKWLFFLYSIVNSLVFLAKRMSQNRGQISVIFLQTKMPS